jgi:predicted aspartyl protease
VTVGFEMSPRGHILVPVSINGSPPLVVALDTAAGRTTVTSAVARQLTLPESPGETAKVAGVHGLTENPVVQLRSVSIGDAEARDFKAVVMDLDHITRGVWRADGILGMDYLQNFDLRLDFGVRTVSLFPRAASPKSCPACPKGRQGIAFESIHTGFIVLPVTVDGRPVRAVLDTGQVSGRDLAPHARGRAQRPRLRPADGAAPSW